MQNEEILLKQVQELAAKVNGEVEESNGQLILKIHGRHLLDVLNAAINFEETPCEFLHDLTALDLGDHFEAVYQLTSLHGPQQLRVKAIIDRDNPVIDSVTRIWEGANFLEREAYDMFGIEFRGHPNLKRIYLWSGFKGYPLRKDFVPESAEERSIVHKHADFEE